MKMEVFSTKGGQCHRSHSVVSVLCSAKGTAALQLQRLGYESGDLAFLRITVLLSFSMKKFPFQIRYVLNKRVVGRVGRSGRGTQYGRHSVWRGVALATRDIDLRTPPPRAASRRPSRAASHLTACALDTTARPPVPHTANHPQQILITFRTTYYT